MTHLRKFYINDDLALVYNDLSKEFGVAAADIKVLNRGNDREYFSSNNEKILSKYWEHSPCEQWQVLKCMLTTKFSILQNVFYLVRIIVILIVLL